jgi:hypothetical protein
MLTPDQQYALDAAVNYTCNKIGSPSDETNAYQAAVDAMDEQCGEMDDLQFAEFSLRLFLQENVRLLAQAKEDLETLKAIFTTSAEVKTPICPRHDALMQALTELYQVQEDLGVGANSLDRFVAHNHAVQERALTMIDKLTSLLAMAQYRTLPAGLLFDVTYTKTPRRQSQAALVCIRD